MSVYSVKSTMKGCLKSMVQFYGIILFKSMVQFYGRLYFSVIL